MNTIGIDDKNCIYLDDFGNIVIKENAEALAQDISTSLSLCNGENPYNINEGIDYDNQILGKLGDFNFIRSEIVNRILENPEVNTVDKIEISYNNNILNVNTNINSIYGNINV